MRVQNVTLNAYDADWRIPYFVGLDQSGDETNGQTTYAREAQNLYTNGGVIQPFAACELVYPPLPRPIETLCRLYRRWCAPDGENKTLLVAASEGHLYACTPDDTEWTPLDEPEGVDDYESSTWSWVTYEINEWETDEDGNPAEDEDGNPIPKDPIDVLLLSNARDGMVMVRGDNRAVSIVDTPKKFGVIERFNERIWGGAIENDPDTLVYSAPYNPLDWQADPDIPENGAGDIQQPSWDGDTFTALRAFGSQLIAFKRTRVWRILGTYPGEFAFKEQFGGGAPYENTIAIDGQNIIMATDRGLVVYDGSVVSPFRQEYIRDVFSRLNREAASQMCAVFWHNNYYLAMPLDGSPINNAVLMFNKTDNSFLLRTDVSVESFLNAEENLLFTSSTTPGRIWIWKEDVWRQNTNPTQASSVWISPWQDFGSKRILKGGFELYLTVTVRDEPVLLNLTIQTQKKVKTKSITFTKQEGKLPKQKRVRFSGSGRRVRFKLDVPAGSPAWQICGGIHIVAETERD